MHGSHFKRVYPSADDLGGRELITIPCTQGQGQNLGVQDVPVAHQMPLKEAVAYVCACVRVCVHAPPAAEGIPYPAASPKGGATRLRAMPHSHAAQVDWQQNTFKDIKATIKILSGKKVH